MVVDLVCVGLVLLFGFGGYRQGFLVQLARLAGLVLAYVGARELGPPLGGWLARGLDLTDILAHSIAFSTVFFLIWLACVLAAKSLSRHMRAKGEAFTFFERGLGGILGAVKGVLWVFLGMSLYIAFQQPIRAALPGVDIDLRGSLVAAEVARHDILQTELLPRVKALAVVARLVNDPTALAHVQRDPAFRALLDHPKAAFLRDPAVVAAFQEGNWTQLLVDPRVLDLLSDRDVAAALAEIGLDGQAPAEVAPTPAPAAPAAPVAPTPAPAEP